ncbi:hypothetical protein KP509_34G014500 [Ceratopteris richardii]|uniref:Phosphatidylinositol-glycan biosynthesis class F protein n=1 Tax=Ceratopteris richardii TaxID=49495 RepID=A0A8T2QIH7_CERRI|nr:hypothetical protein KP509_34G014500 [Ceratopteris richardii]
MAVDTQNKGYSRYSIWKVFLLHFLPPVVLFLGIWVLPYRQGLNLIEHPAETLRIAGVLQVFFSIVMYSFMSLKERRCPSVWMAIWRSILSLPIGAFVLIFIAIIFGAPWELEHRLKSAFWGQLISAIVVLPAGIVLGGSWLDWQRLFASTRPQGVLEYSVCIPAHGAVIGAWFGAWPMPLDWERPWQEWPVSVTYGMAAGYFAGEIISFILSVVKARNEVSKED